MTKLGKPEPDSDVVNREPKVLLIGYGWVGQFMGGLFTNADYVTGDGVVRNKEGKEIYKTVDPLKVRYDLAIIGVPTPMKPENGQCDVSVVERVVKKYRPIVDYFLIKSTVRIGTTDDLKEKYGVRIAMSPEYVGETLGHPLTEPKRDVFQIIGGEPKTAEKIAEFFMKVLTAQAPILLVSALEAEVIKYMENYWITRVVDYWNDVYEVCNTFGISFQKVREGIVLDPRMGRTHSNVYKDNRGWSGKCLPKDMNALAFSLRSKGKPIPLLEHLIEKNAFLRRNYQDKNKLLPEKPLWRETSR